MEKRRFDRYGRRGTLNLRLTRGGKNTSGHRARPFRSRFLKSLLTSAPDTDAALLIFCFLGVGMRCTSVAAPQKS